MRPTAIMLQGMGSDVGKSLIAAGLCRAYTRRGLAVRPFKPQNMSNNAAVTVEGGEIGRAQALQARACGLSASVDMNPVLLKPQSDRGSQVVVQGKVIGALGARDYAAAKARLMPAVLESFHRLVADSDLVVVEGAGGPAEVNLRDGDIANMGFAEAADLPVILIGDIDRGGVIASLVGTAALLSQSECNRIKGFLINKFRGDPELFSEGIRIIEMRTGFRPLGIVPYFPQARRLPAEDSVSIPSGHQARKGDEIKIAVLRLARIANFDDFDPLIAEPDVSLTFVDAGEALPGDADLVILPGSKATIADLTYLREQGWDLDIAAHIRRGGQLLGICGGLQMLGREIHDPEGREGAEARAEGLGYLAVNSVISAEKRLVETFGKECLSGEAVAGYEMHMGVTDGAGCDRPMLILDGRPDGAVSESGNVMGCYLHGLFAADGFRHTFLSRLRPRRDSGLAFEAEVETTLDSLADHLERHVDLEAILEIARAGPLACRERGN